MTRLTGVLIMAMALAGCSSLPPLEAVKQVDLDRFMGDWYVIACTPTFLDDDAYNAIESYRRSGEDRIETTYTFNKAAFDGKTKTYRPTGFVKSGTGNAIWGMRFIWPFKADYRIVYLDDTYQTTIIGRAKRDMFWIMAREPVIAPDDYKALLAQVEATGYDLSELREIPQQPLQDRTSREP